MARKQVGHDRLYQDALAVIRAAREATPLLIEARCTMRANTTEDSVRAAAAAFARYIGGLCAEPATRDGLLKTAVREISLQLFDEFGDHYRLAEQLQTMAELAWLGPAALRAAEIAGTRGPSEHALGDVPIACISSAGFTPPP